MPRNDEGIYPLSKMQERIWFLSQLYPESSQYNIPLAIQLQSGPIDLQRFTKALNRVVRENEILRTSFEETDKGVRQKVHASLNVQVDFEDISDRKTSSEMAATIEKISRDHGSTLFVLSELPLFTAKLLKTGEGQYVLLLNLHHLISDGWSNSMLAREMSMFYSDETGESADTDKYQYIDYVKWEQKWLQSNSYNEQLEFWKNELANLPEVFHLPGPNATEGDVFEGRTESQDLPAALHERVTKYCQKNGITPFQFYISCYALLLNRYAGNSDLIIGTVVANRMQRFFQDTYGVFINSLPLRFPIDTASSFQQLIGVFKEKIKQSLASQAVPFSEIVRAIKPQRNLNENPLYNVHFAYQHFPQAKKDDEYVPLSIDYQVSKFDINFWINITSDERNLVVSYKNKIISKEKICRFMDHFLLLADAVMEQPDTPVREIDFIPQKDKSILQADKHAIQKLPWIKLFENSVRESSELTAFVDEQGELSYKSLNLRAAQLAIALNEQGVKKGDVVIIHTARGRNFIISMLACMKCGATYLPTDQGIPAKRFSHILDESGASIVITETDIKAANCLLLGNLAFNPEQDYLFESIDVSDEDIVYIIYTSGSSGKPKGVCIPHHALINYACVMRDRIADDDIRSFAHVSALDADLGNTSIFLALGFSGSLLMPPADALVDPLFLSSFFSNHPADVLKIVPSHLEALSEGLDGILPQKLLICGGETLSSELVSKVQAQRPQLRVINHYGPAEATIGSLTYEVSAVNKEALIPIGEPIENTSVILMDQDLNIVPKGALGEICLMGDNIASGYLAQPDLSKDSFIQKNIPGLPEARAYRSGDLGYLNDEEKVVYSRRLDRQVKINGFRVELQEIEIVLNSFHQVSNSTVFFTGKNNKVKKLVAAVKLQNQAEAQEIKIELAKYFPQALVPALFILDEIPLTRNGKVDLNRLKNMYLDSFSAHAESQPRDLIELSLVEIFRSVLDVDMIQPEDQFFDLGGHSLLAISLIAKINSSFQTDFQIATLFQYGSVKALASLIRSVNDSAVSSVSPYVPLIKRGKNKSITWVHPAGGNVMCYYPVAKAFSRSYDSNAFTASSNHSGDDISISGMAGDYSSFFDDQTEQSVSVLAGWSMGALIAHEMAVVFAEKGVEHPLILVDQPIPHNEPQATKTYEESLLNYIEKIEVFTDDHIHLPEMAEGKIDYDSLYREFIRLDLMPEEVAMANFKNFLDMLVKHNNIISDHHPSIYRGPALLLKADEKIMQKTSSPQPEYSLDDLGWGDFCTKLTVLEVPGNHITMLTEQHVAVTAERIQGWLAQI